MMYHRRGVLMLRAVVEKSSHRGAVPVVMADTCCVLEVEPKLSHANRLRTAIIILMIRNLDTYLLILYKYYYAV